MFENMRAEKRRSDPDRAQRRDETKLKGRDRGCDKGRGARLLITAGTDERNGAFMLSGLSIMMDPFVPTRRNTQGERRKKRKADPARDYAAKHRGRERPHHLALHRLLDSLMPALGARNFIASLFATQT
jgi:hypothetical protein